MRKAAKLLWLAGVLVTGMGCGRETIRTPRELVRYMESEDHQLVQTVTTDRVTYKVQLATPEYLAAKETDAESKDANTAWKQRAEELKGHLFFLVKIRDKQGNAPADADGRNLYYATAAQQDMRLQYGDAVLSPAVCHYENNYGLVAYNTLVVGFETGTGPMADAAFAFSDRWTGTPHIQASYSAAQLSALPSIQP